jgi:enoyl-CoA hydratase
MFVAKSVTLLTVKKFVSPREKIALNSPAAMAATKRALWGALEHGLTDACKAGAQELVSMWGHPDQTEGPLAFAEKREPSWVLPE